ncbi:MAG: c-type cytochrome [Anaerolineales bacterium]|jgi:mono/diheme cytochrome c family protein|nr:c-type cytochrome [Anaerolineales bacterium]
MKFRVIFLVALLGLALSGCLSLAEDITPPPDYVPPAPAPTLGALFPAAAPDIAKGAALYAEKCAPCHGPGGQGDGPQADMLSVEVPALAQPAVARRAAPAAWFGIVTQGNLTNFMPGFASLSDPQRWDVVAYAHSLSTSPAEVAAGQAVYEANCALCHGPNGKSAPNADFTNLQWLASRSLDDWAGSVRQGLAPEMPAFEGQLADADIYAALAYARTFAYSAPLAVSPPPDSAQSAASTPEAAAPAEAESLPNAPAETGETIPVDGGQVSGLVSSGAGVDLPSGLKVVLHGFDHGAGGSFAETLTREASLAADGRYLFEKVEVPEGRAFYVSLNYEGLEYASEAAFVQDGLVAFDLPIEIYATSSDSSLLEIAQAHVLLDFSTPQKITIIHFFVIDNPSQTTIVAPSEGQPVVAFRLPQGFENLEFEDGALGGRFLMTEDGFGDTTTVLPGEGQYQLVFAYDLPYSAPSGLARLWGSSAQELSLPLTLGARSVTILVPEGVTASAPGLADAGLQQMGGSVNFQMYRAGALPPGQELKFEFSGSPKSAATLDEAPNSNQNIIIGIGALGIVLIAVGGYLFWRERRRAAEEQDFPDDPETLAEDERPQPEIGQDEILDAILALDDQFKAGNLSETAYHERRAQLKTQLKKM